MAKVTALIEANTPEHCLNHLEISFIGKMTLALVEGVSVRVGADEQEALVEGLSSGQLFLDGGPSSSSALETK